MELEHCWKCGSEGEAINRGDKWWIDCSNQKCNASTEDSQYSYEDAVDLWNYLSYKNTKDSYGQLACEPINIEDYISQNVEHSNKGLNIKITSHIDMQGLSKAISDEIDEQLLYEVATRHGYVKRNNEDYLKEIYYWAYENMECCDEPEWSLFSGLYSVIGQYYMETKYYREQ